MTKTPTSKLMKEFKHNFTKTIIVDLGDGKTIKRIIWKDLGEAPTFVMAWLDGFLEAQVKEIEGIIKEYFGTDLSNEEIEAFNKIKSLLKEEV